MPVEQAGGRIAQGGRFYFFYFACVCPSALMP